MPLVALQSSLVEEGSAVTLAMYAQILGRGREDEFWGVMRDDTPELGCKQLWIKSERDRILKYLSEAQFEIENEIDYLLSPKWIVGDFNDEPNSNMRYVDQQQYKIPVFTKWGHYIEAGVRATSNIQRNAPVSHATDPAVIGPLATTVTDATEIHVYHPYTNVEIDYSQIVLHNGFVTIYIPRCRMATADAIETNNSNAANRNIGIAYGTIGNFESEVDVIRVFNNPAVNAELVSPHTCGSSVCSLSSCGEYVRNACMYVKDRNLGIVDVLPATYSGGSWGASSANCCNGGSLVRLNYRAGVVNLTRQQFDTIVRLAHAKMPETPCGSCEPANAMWNGDMEIPKALTIEQGSCPFGQSNGAWAAWKFTQSMKTVKASSI